MISPALEWKVIVLVVLIGLDFLSIVPPVLAVCNKTWGDDKGPSMFGLMFAMHQIGAAIGALVPGNIRDATGSYDSAWSFGCVLCLVAGFQIAFVPAFGPALPPGKGTEMV